MQAPAEDALARARELLGDALFAAAHPEVDAAAAIPPLRAIAGE